MCSNTSLIHKLNIPLGLFIYCEKKTWANEDHKNCALSYAKNEGGLFPSFISVLGNLDNRGKLLKLLDKLCTP